MSLISILYLNKLKIILNLIAPKLLNNLHLSNLLTVNNKCLNLFNGWLLVGKIIIAM
jgi:hypothetical protein